MTEKKETDNKEDFKLKFIKYFNENIKSEDFNYTGETNLKKLEIMVRLDGFADVHLQNAYRCIVQQIKQRQKQEDNISIRVLNERMVDITDFNKGQPKLHRDQVTKQAWFLVIKAPRRAVRITDIDSRNGIIKYRDKFVTFFNNRNRINADKQNVYDTFEFKIAKTEFEDIKTLYDKFKIEVGNREGYKVYQVFKDLLTFKNDKLPNGTIDNNNYVVRFDYGE